MALYFIVFEIETKGVIFERNLRIGAGCEQAAIEKGVRFLKERYSMATRIYAISWVGVSNYADHIID